MRKIFVLGLLFFTLLLQFCTSAKKAGTVAKKEPVVSYKANIAPIMIASCAPCHFPPKGNKEPFDTYTSVKTGIDEILERIQKNPGERGFMPARHDKLSDSTIQLIRTWKETGFAE